ncbi:hypothetical protein K504DRAFT_506261 [Pleomassaria siparia CBS 279.74]|uniref:Uncharacterized protein n=1 Tax=Pleomassaria siparia CBS 279.74 TaxID=1314801 RepID=A0A6G1JXI3_9PLEO|nr:hypothetical protein K504DRAFT_506261 [Pleomassaria siparia CBS 279.74]
MLQVRKLSGGGKQAELYITRVLWGFLRASQVQFSVFNSMPGSSQFSPPILNPDPSFFVGTAPSQVLCDYLPLFVSILSMRIKYQISVKSSSPFNYHFRTEQFCIESYIPTQPTRTCLTPTAVARYHLCRTRPDRKSGETFSRLQSGVGSPKTLIKSPTMAKGLKGRGTRGLILV